jgi:hypothetical protein
MICTCIALVALAVQGLDVFIDTTIEGALKRHGGGSMERISWKGGDS